MPCRLGIVCVRYTFVVRMFYRLFARGASARHVRMCSEIAFSRLRKGLIHMLTHVMLYQGAQNGLGNDDDDDDGQEEHA